jgi:hypothetical protein
MVVAGARWSAVEQDVFGRFNVSATNLTVTRHPTMKGWFCLAAIRATPSCSSCCRAAPSARANSSATSKRAATSFPAVRTRPSRTRCAGRSDEAESCVMAATAIEPPTSPSRLGATCGRGCLRRQPDCRCDTEPQPTSRRGTGLQPISAPTDAPSRSSSSCGRARFPIVPWRLVRNRAFRRTLGRREPRGHGVPPRMFGRGRIYLADRRPDTRSDCPCWCSPAHSEMPDVSARYRHVRADQARCSSANGRANDVFRNAFNDRRRSTCPPRHHRAQQLPAPSQATSRGLAPLSACFGDPGRLLPTGHLPRFAGSVRIVQVV